MRGHSAYAEVRVAHLLRGVDRLHTCPRQPLMDQLARKAFGRCTELADHGILVEVRGQARVEVHEQYRGISLWYTKEFIPRPSHQRPAGVAPDGRLPLSRWPRGEVEHEHGE
eukprot:530806-Pyramimonas_sp.AAC.1